MSLWDTFREVADNVVPDDIGGMISTGIGAIPGAQPVFETLDKAYNEYNAAWTWGISALPGGTRTATWDEAHQISPGQMAQTNASSIAPFAAGIGGPGTAAMYQAAESTITPQLAWNKPGFDVYNAEQRKRVFEEDGLGRWASGWNDGTLAWFADPLVIGGKALKVARKAGAIRPIEDLQDVNKGVKELDDHLLWLNSSGMQGRSTALGRRLARTVKKDAAQMWWDPIARTSNNRGLVSALLGEAKDYETSALVVKAGMGHAPSMEALWARQASVADALERATKLSEAAEASFRAPIGSLPAGGHWQRAPEELDKLRAVLDDLTAKDEWLAKAVTVSEGDITRLGGVGVVGDVQTYVGARNGIRKYDTAGKARRARETVFQRNPFARVVRVWDWAAGERPAGWVDVKGSPAGESGREIYSAMNEARSIRQTVDDVQFRTDMMNVYLRATTVEGRAEAVYRIERTTADRIADRILGDAIPNAAERRAFAQSIYDSYDRARSTASEYMKSRGFLVDVDGSIIKSPQLTSQLADGIPMMDFRTYEALLKRTQSPLRKAAGKTKDVLKDILDAAYSAWKASVLFRGGWTARDVLEGNLRAMAAIGFVPMLADPWGTASRFARNQANLAKYGKDYVTDLVAQRTPKQILKSLEAAKDRKRMLQSELAENVSEGRYARQWDPPDATGIETLPFEEYVARADEFGVPFNIPDLEGSIGSATASLLPTRQRKRFLMLHDIEQTPGRMLTKEFADEYRALRAKASRTRIRELQAQGMDVVYRDPKTGKMVHVTNPRDIPSDVLVPLPASRRGVPGKAIEDEVAPAPGFFARDEPQVFLVESWKRNVRAAMEMGEAVPGRNAARVRGRNPKPVGGYVSDLNDEARANMIRLNENIRLADEQIGNLLDALDVAVARRPKAGWRKRLGDDDAFAGPRGAVARANASADKTYENVIMDMLSSGEQRLSRQNNWTRINPGEKGYFENLAWVVNKQLRNDPVAMRLLRGDNAKDIRDWLRSRDSYNYRREMGFTVDEAIDHIDVVNDMVTRYVPDRGLRLRASEADLTPDEIAGRLAKKDDLAPIHGREAAALSVAGNGRRAYRKTMAAVYRWLGSIPENYAVRHPFYRKVWMGDYERRMQIAVQQGVELTPAVQARLANSAHNTALKATKETLYTIERYSNPTAVLRWLMPFYAAWENTMKVWLKLAINDPSIVARADMIWNLPNSLGMVVDENGKQLPAGAEFDQPQYIVLPDGLGKALSKYSAGYIPDIPKASLNVILQGEVPWIPSVGPLVTTPVSLAIAARPDLETTLKEYGGEMLYRQLVPFGRPTDDAVDTLAPAWMKRLKTLAEGENSDEFLNSVLSIWRDDYQRWQLGEGPEPDAEQAVEKAREYWKLRMIANLTLPFAPRFRSEFKFYIDEYRRLTTEKGFVDGAAEFDKMYPDFAVFKKSLTKGDVGMSPDQQAYARYEAHKSLFNKLTTMDPKLGQLVTNPVNRGEFSPAVYEWMTGRPIKPGSNVQFRDVKTVDDFEKEIAIDQGWKDYMDAKAKMDLWLRENGLTDKSQSPEAEDAWRAWMEQQEKKNPVWFTEWSNHATDAKVRQTIGALQTILADEKFMAENGNDRLWVLVQEYMDKRNLVIAELQRRHAAGGSGSFTAKVQNADIIDAWSQVVAQLKAADTTFADFYDRWLDQDNMKVVTTDAAAS